MRKIILIFALCALVFAALPAGAMTQSEIQALIAQLQQQILQLQAQLVQMQSAQTAQNSTQTPSAPASNFAWCHTFNKDLGYANSGSDEVVALHTVLKKEGISYSPDGQDIYGPATAAAVVRFQMKHQVSQTGYVGPLTRARLNALYRCSEAGTGIACTQDAKLCPDGSYVSRVGPSCEFAPCQEVLKCNPNWQCGSWNACGNNQQTRVCTDLNNCGVTTDKPSTEQACVAGCTPSWQCGAWSVCKDYQRTRTCTDLNNCGVATTNIEPCVPPSDGIAPIVTSVTPSGVAKDDSNFTIDVYGTGFKQGSSIRLDNYVIAGPTAPILTVFDSTHLQATLDSFLYSGLYQVGQHSLSVLNSDGKASNAVRFDILPLKNPVSITSVSPAWAAENQTKVLTIYGQGFKPGSVVMIDSSRNYAINTTYVSPTQLRTTIITDSKYAGYLKVGTHYITIENGGIYSEKMPFTVMPEGKKY